MFYKKNAVYCRSRITQIPPINLIFFSLTHTNFLKTLSISIQQVRMMVMAHKSILFSILMIVNSSVGQTSPPECVKAKNPLGECCGDEQLWINENCTQVRVLE